MKTFFVGFLGITTTFLMVAVVCAEPVVPGLAGKHPLDQRQVGALLLNELRCAACHQRTDKPVLPERVAPDLAEVGSRIAPEFLRKFIASPSAMHAGSTMPEMLTGTAKEREEIARAITHFLVAKSSRPFKPDVNAGQDAAAGRELFHSVGCIACHSPRGDKEEELTGQGVVKLGHLSAKYSRESLGDFLFQPLRVRPSGRMPDMKLTRPEAHALASYLMGDAKSESPLKPEADLVARGKQYFEQFNCSACHKLPDIPAAKPAGALAKLDLQRGCLAEANNGPRYGLSESQTQSLRAALAEKPADSNDRTRIGITLTAFNCIACHARDDYGGVAEDRNLLFQTSEKNLGDDARIPPPLTLAGAKLQTLWMKKVLFDAESVRPYMFTRMPQYGEANVGHLPDVFARLDAVKEAELSIPNPERESDRAREKELRAAGRELLGDKGLYCVACHNFNGKLSPNHKGIDLMTSHERLRPSWFYHFMREPTVYRPRIVMPASWPDGEAVQKTILNGNTDKQIEAIWYYLSLGTSAADPSGIRGIESRLDVTDTTRTYRGRSGIAGYRGIAVGFPGGLNYAFNAETGSLSGLWRGEFLRVDRSGQGSGGFHPAGRAIALPQDVGFVELADEQAAWPLRPTMTKEHPANPNPLYPKNLGYQFKGYFFDEASIPTLMYRSGVLEIEDRSATEKVGEKQVLKRSLQFTAPKASAIWLRPLTGKITAESKQQFKTDDVRLSIPEVHTVLRPFPKVEDGTQELLIRFDLPSGKSTVTITYELLR